MLRTILTIGAATIVVAACTANSGAGGSEPPASSVPAGSVGSRPCGRRRRGAPARIDHRADRRSTPRRASAWTRREVTIVDAHAETWSDGSLGCPQPGMMYTQALVEGYQVIVEANGTQLDYRGGGQGGFRLCENP